MLDLYGERGQQWLKHLPELGMEYVRRWRLVSVLEPYPADSASFVAPAVRQDGTTVVLKIGVPDRELRCQIENLRACAGQGMVRLLESDLEQCALLMEQVLPGCTLESLGREQEEYATQIALSVMQQLWRPAPLNHAYQRVSLWATDLERLRHQYGGETGPFPAALVERAERHFQDGLAVRPPDRTLIHGDMNPGNILLGQDGWVAIDPKGVVGDPLYDVATFLNYVPEDDSDDQIRTLLARRVQQFAEGLGIESEQVKAWGQAHAVLAGWWQFEDHHGHEWEPALRIAGLYD